MVSFVFASLFSDRGSQDTHDAKPITGGKVTLICIAPRREHTSQALRHGTRSQGISQCYLHTPRSSAFSFPAEAGRRLQTPEGWKAELAWVAGT